MVVNGVTSDGSKVTTCTVCHTAVTCAASARYQQLRGAKSAFPPLNAGSTTAICMYPRLRGCLAFKRSVHSRMRSNLDRKDAQQDADSRRVLMRPCAATPSLVADELVLERDAPTRSKVGGLLAEVGNRAP